MKNPKVIVGGVVAVLLLAIGIFAATGGFGKASPIITPTPTSNNDSVSPIANSNQNDRYDSATVADACKLFSASEAGEIFGTKVAPSTDKGSSCTYTTDSMENFGVMVFSITPISYDSETYYLNGITQVDADSKKVQVAGTSQAYWLNTVKQLHVIKDGRLIVVSIIADSVADKEQEACAEVANKIIERL